MIQFGVRKQENAHLYEPKNKTLHCGFPEEIVEERGVIRLTANDPKRGSLQCSETSPDGLFVFRLVYSLIRLRRMAHKRA
jgi:hypothetical protein